jgi:predicted amidohydrolase
MRIALAAVPYPASPEEAVAQVARSVTEAARKGAAIVAFPEASMPGYRGLGRDPGAVSDAFLEHAWRKIAEVAAAENIAVVLGTERRIANRLRLTALVIDSGGRLVGFQDKVQLDPSEHTPYAPGDERRLFTLGELTFGVVICHEGWRYPETVRWAARRGAKLVFHLHLSESDSDAYRPASYGDPSNTFHEKAALCRAAENTIYYAGVNYATPRANAATAIVNPDGTLLAWHPHREPGLLISDLDLTLATGLLAGRCREYDYEPVP